MPLNPGNETIVFISQTWDGTPDRYGIAGPVKVSRSVEGCTLQPLSERDNITNTFYSEATEKCLAPANEITLAIKRQDYLQDADGLKYRIMGIRPYRDSWGRVDHITFICKYEEG